MSANHTSIDNSSHERRQSPVSTSNRDNGGILLSTVQSAKRGHRERSEQQKKQHRKLSALETLPTELLEKIFLYSLNVNYAHASPFLAAAVSSERIYRLLILLAFWDDSEVDHYHDVGGMVGSSKGIGPYYATSFHLGSAGSPHLIPREDFDPRLGFRESVTGAGE